MRLYATDPLFAWARLEDHPQLSTLKQLLQLLPDEELLEGLRLARGHGRDDYPIDHLWSVIVLTVALRHASFESCLAELHRNPSLYRLVGIPSAAKIPNLWNISRFLDVLGEQPHLCRVRTLFDLLVRPLGRAVPDLGVDTAGDSTGLSGRAKKDKEAVKEEIEQGLPQPSGGKKEYTDEEGKVVKEVRWFGYKLHLLVDIKHEVPLAYQITDANAGDNELIDALLDQAKGNLPQQRMKSLAYDKAADDVKVHQRLHQEQIKPLIQNRALWQQDPERHLPTKKGQEGRYPLNVVHDEAGTLYCYDTVSDPPVRHKMAYMGYEKDRDSLKYRCPARHEDWPCPSEEKCNAGREFGMIVRVESKLDLRRFPPIPRATKEFERRYKGRTAVERVNARMKVFWGVDDGNVTGSRRFHAYVGVVMVVCVALATLLARTARREGSMGNTRLGPIARALQEEELLAAQRKTQTVDGLAPQEGNSGKEDNQTQTTVPDNPDTS